MEDELKKMLLWYVYGVQWPRAPESACGADVRCEKNSLQQTFQRPNVYPPESLAKGFSAQFSLTLIQGKIVTGERKACGRDFDWDRCDLEDQSVCGDEI